MWKLQIDFTVQNKQSIASLVTVEIFKFLFIVSVELENRPLHKASFLAKFFSSAPLKKCWGLWDCFQFIFVNK